ncbi:hypothetical protein F511_30926 [Dorcoceras hygrometricum]|uniref:Uncharacterized protein n=1 Tax=Dorcoceras hygrometricum TaxID=472368 RepID=A0A2Z7CRE9_9LAMI|nr:hypothetical protein F511_30926 [Dorcoceras hygrometricum]
MMNSRRICPADGSQYKRSAVGLVFMESAAGLAMETSKVESIDVVEEIQSQATVLSADVIWRLAIAKRCRLHKLIRQRFALALKIQQMLFALISSRKIPAGSICLIPAGQPDASNNSIQSRAYMNQLLLYIQSQATVDQVASFSVIAYPVDLDSQTQEKKNSSAKYPVDKVTAVARSVVTKNKQQLSEQLLNNQLKNIQPLQAINAQDGKNKWLRFNRASCLNSRRKIQVAVFEASAVAQSIQSTK